MGWDAFATKSNGKTLPRTPIYEGWLPRNPLIRLAFRRAVERVKQQESTVDGSLRHGALDCSPCAHAIERATGIDAWGDDLSGRQVRDAARCADWSLVDDQPGWAVASAREFLNTCARYNLGVYFSW